MKIRDLEIFVVAPPPPGWGGRYWIFVKLTADSGIAGIGEVYASSVGPEAMKAVIEDVFERHMLGENPENIELMFRRAYSSGFTQRPDPTSLGAFSGLEIACWDILGKDAGKPVHALLGGMTNSRVRSYSYLYPLSGHEPSKFWTDPCLAAESAASMVQQGFTAVKFDPAGPYTIRGGHQPAMFDIELSIEFCREIRRAVGSRADLLFGTHGQFSTSGAIRLGRAIEEFNPLWFEEPVPPDNLLEFAEVARRVRIPVAAGERLAAKSEFGTLLRTGGASILQPALGRVGGILEAKKISGMAEAFNAQMAPHLYAGPVEWAASIQLAATLPNLLIVETVQTGGEFHLALINNSILWENGYIRTPVAPGLGIEFNEDLAREHAYQGKGLHLEMQESPCDYGRAKPQKMI
ncbi:MAG: mandelate racemase/muconate lactonizing enzyme family protein [Albidovulum sp.]|nr:mandelate racemase/muconate lactonizing enzyme family protein [Albidovulum sp.]MDE0305065.1 mandelate racemase/muconate lactonizing enzyme family protein [Albidovulum sp.]MDE0533527.1 mandelate racemase/muconate lactonizing enzyme family protein [Albidovulum sp.]